MASFYTAEGQENHYKASDDEKNMFVIGNDNVISSITSEINRYFEKEKSPCLLALDGYSGVVWEKILTTLKAILSNKKYKVEIIEINSYLKNDSEIEKLVKSCFSNDPDFGFVFDGTYEELFDLIKVKELINELMNKKTKSGSTGEEVVICYGNGAAINQVLTPNGPNDIFDYTVYFDIIRQELFNRSEEEAIYLLGDTKCAYPVHENLDRFWYLDSRVLDKHKRIILNHVDFYIDCSNQDELKMIPKKVYRNILSTISKSPISLKQLYYSTAWGGEWQKNLKNLPDSLVNSGQGQIVPNDNSIEIVVDTGNEIFSLNIPFMNLMWQEGEGILGKHASEVSQGEFPLCYFYDDEIDGGNMAIQVHPDDEYMKKNFNESGGQDETYYILHTEEGAKTYIGLTEDADIDEFRREVVKSNEQGVKIDYKKFIHSVDTKPHDFFLIPAGTIHASGKNQVVVEIDWVSTSYTPGYTFHVYDYMRPDLDGTIRDMHIDHAFKQLKERRSPWVMKNLSQEPVLIREGEDFAEYIIGKIEDMRFKTHRLEFEKEINDRTEQDGTFHALTLVEGESVTIRSQSDPKKKAELHFPDTIIVPASMRDYTIINQGDKPCKVIKAMVD